MTSETFQKTDKLALGKLRQGKQPWLVAKALMKFTHPVSVDDLAEAVRKDGYENHLNDWAKEHGGVEASILYHLRRFQKSGMAR